MAPQDDRTVPRHAMGRRVALHFSRPEEYLEAFTSNISKGGMFVHTANPPLPGSKVDLALTVDGIEGEVTLPAVVAHTRSDGIGVRFEPFDEQRTAAVDRLCRDAQGRLQAMAGVSPTLLKPGGEEPPKTPAPGEGLLPPGTLVDGRYRVLSHIASGGMGEVYEAEHVYMRRTLALKVLHPQFGNDEEMATRFQREAQIASSLDHPNIVRVFDFGKTGDGKLFLAMELVVGEQLEDLLVREGAMQAPRAVALMAQICDAVHDAHIHGIIHRDLKLANVIVMKRHDEEEPKVLDFGIARLADEASTGNKSVTRRGIVVGTPEYLSPEQALGQPIDARADIYSLGIMIYTLLAGRLPFFSENLRLVVTMQLTQPPPPLTDFAPHLRAYPGICAAVLKALEKERDRRFATAALFGQALRDGLRGESAPEVVAPAATPIALVPDLPAVAPAPESADEVTPCSRCGQRVLKSERFCSACGAPVAPPCPRCQNPTSPGAKFCPACGLEFSPRPITASRSVAQLPPSDPSDPGAQTLARLQEIASFLPPRTFDAMVDARAQVRGEERRYVTALWVALGPGAQESRLRSLAAGLEAIHESGGVINLIGANCVLAFFGALTAREDDAYRALTAGLEIQRRVRSAGNGQTVEVRVGLHAGVAVPGEVTAEGESSSSETVGLARALAEAAAPGQVLASTSLGEAGGPYLDTIPGPVLTPEGSGETVLSIQIDGFRTPARVNRPELCGREKAMAAFQTLVLATEGGKTKPVLLVGGPGIGKSRLAEEVQRLAEGRGWTVSTARRDPDAASTPFGAVGELVLEMLRVPRAARHQALREALTGVLKSQGDRAILEQITGVSPRLGRLRAGAVASAVKSLEGVLTRERPALLVFEDLDRTDPGSRRVFKLLCDTHKPVGSLLFGISRTELQFEDRPTAASVYKVPALSAESSLALVRSVLGDVEIPEQLAVIAKRAQGTPRRIVDYLHLLLDRRTLVEGPSGIYLVQQPRDLPETPLDLARERILSLSADERYLLQVAALIGHTFDGQLLKRILTGLDVPGLVKDAQARGLLVPASSHAHFQFVTEEIRQAFLVTVPPQEAAKLHRHLAESLRKQAATDGTPVPEGAVARHLSAAGDRTGAIQGLVRAASQDLAARNLAGAALWLVEAGAESVQLGNATGTARAAECFSRAASLAASSGEVELAETPLAKALEILPGISDPAIQSEIYLAQAAVARARGEPLEARTAAQKAFGAFNGAVPTKRLALLAAQAGAAALASGDAAEALQLLSEALPMAEADRFAPWFGIQDLEAQLLADLGTAYASIGQIPTGAGYLDKALRRVRPRRDFALEAQILKRLATLAENAGEGPSAASHHQAAAEAAETAGDLETTALEYYALARLKHREGVAADARTFAARATDICQQIGWEEGLGLARGLFES
jgi:serine/threonine protein kinase/tetratricopeptide (TPR) repeat protein